MSEPRPEAPISFTTGVEGLLDTAVVQRLLTDNGLSVGPVFGRNGIHHLLRRIRGYNQAAIHTPWFVVFDLDDQRCAPERLADVLPNRSRYMCCRIAVRSVESWLLADAERLASYLRIRLSQVPADPDALESPKSAMVNLARQSSRAIIREEMTPRPGASTRTGPAYTSRLVGYVTDTEGGWRPEVAAQSSSSLSRCIADLRRSADLYRADIAAQH